MLVVKLEAAITFYIRDQIISKNLSEFLQVTT